MNSRRSRRALVFVHAPHAEHGAGGAFLAIICGGAGYDRTRRSSLTSAFGELLNFHVRLVCAHSPNSPVERPPRPSGASSAGVVHRLARTGLEGLRLRDFLLASACRASAFCIASRVARFSLLAFSRVSVRFLLLRCVHPTLRGGIEHRTLRCCDFHSVLLLCLPLCARQSLSLWP